MINYGSIERTMLESKDTFALVLATERARKPCAELTGAMLGRHVAAQRRQLGGIFYVLPHQKPMLRELDTVLFIAEIGGFLAHESKNGSDPAPNDFEYAGFRETPVYSLCDAVLGQPLDKEDDKRVRRLIAHEPLLRAACGATRDHPDDFTEFPCDRNAFPVTVHVVVGLSVARATVSAPALLKYRAKHRTNGVLNKHMA